MKRIWIALGACLVASTAAAEELSLKDLQALEHQQSWAEILKKADRVKPTARDASWTKLVTAAATHIVDDFATKDSGIEAIRGAVAVVPASETKYPFLTGDKGYVAAKAKAVARIVTTCRMADVSCGTVIVALTAGVDRVAKNAAKDIAVMVSDDVSPSEAIRFWRLAAAEDPATCAAGRLSKSVVAVLGSAGTGAAIADAQQTAEVCYGALETTLVTSLGDAAPDSPFSTNACPVMKRHPGANVAKKKHCH